MAITLEVGVQNASCDAAVDLMDVGTTNLGGSFVFRTVGDAEVATNIASDPAFGASSSGTATAASIGDDTSATGGVTTKYTMEDRDNAKLHTGTVTVTSGGGDIEISSTTIGAGDTVSITAYTYTQPAS